MTSLRFAPWLLAAFTLMLAGAAWAAQGPQAFRLPGAHWSLAVPEGWKVSSAEQLEAVNAEAREKLGAAGPHFAAMLVPEAQLGPYALIQLGAQPLRGATYEDLERAFDAETLDKSLEKVRKSLGTEVSESRLGKGVLDRARNRVTMDLSLKGEDLDLRGRTFTMLGAEGAVNVHCYAPAQTFEAHAGTFEALASSVMFDPGAEFIAAPAGSKGGGGLSPGVIGGVIGAIVAGMLGAWRRKGKKQDANPAPGDASGGSA